MGLFNSNKAANANNPYRDSAANLVYNLLFCDNLELLKQNISTPVSYPFDVLFNDSSTVADLQKIIDDETLESRLKIFAYNQQMLKGHKPTQKELLAVVIEVALDEGLDVLGSFKDGTARYINYSGKMVVWEATDATSNALTSALFSNSFEIVKRIGVWDEPRRPFPMKGLLRITFLVSDGIYFGEGPIDALFNDQLANPALMAGTELMRYITDKAMNK
ncbi:hypothetical protein [Pseudochryseolinea flava]|uniref:Uncharacterized protein n=1 Tax=Pseudochryseolinea flava TaxID=2059302 RepID=A0A364Y4G4_9BACT|nr:hypothetical protein [Pseudochryseolinea flava]RAW01830.1 hypothetical protein DQQ10_09305 [Pseudochryseolinea flava]